MSEELRSWLADHDLDHLESILVEHDVDLDILAHLSDSDLKEIGLTLGSRRRLLSAIASSNDQGDFGEQQLTSGTITGDQAERRQLSVMFCDLVGSTALSVQFDPEDMRDLIAKYREECARVVSQYGGYIGHYGGDGMLIYFGYPLANEYDAANSVWAGLEICRCVAELDGLGLQVRVGIATGMVVAGDLTGPGTHERYAVVGETPNLAARLMSIAEPGSLVVSEKTKELLADLFEFKSKGEHTLKGFDDPVPVWRVASVPKAHSRSEVLDSREDLPPIIARRKELQQLISVWDQARGSSGRVVLLSGEAGIGKSHLVRHFREHIRAVDPKVVIKRLFCSPNHTNTSFYPFISLLTEAIGLERHDAKDVAIDKIRKFLTDHEVAIDSGLFAICDLLGIELEGKTDLSFDSLRSIQLKFLINYITNSQDIINIFVEDVHWIDPSSNDLFLRLMGQIGSLDGLLILFTFRNNYDPDWPIEHDTLSIRLGRLSDSEAMEIVELASTVGNLPVGIVEEIIEKSDRVPLFIEEVCRATCEQIISSQQTVNDTNEIEVSVPSSLSDSLMARLDRLGAARRTTQVAATIGGIFSSDLVANLMQIDAVQCQDILSHLVDLNVIRVIGHSDTDQFVFRHSLLQDVAYSSLLLRERERLHAHISRLLIEENSGAAEREPEFIALHCTKGGLIKQAIDFWQIAAEKSRQRSANSEAISHSESGLALLKELPASEANAIREMDLRVNLALATAAIRGGGAPEVGENYRRARALSQGSSDTQREFKIILGSWVYQFIGADLRQANQLSGELLDIAVRSGQDSMLLEANRVRGQTLLYQGEFAESQRHIECSLDLYDETRHGPHAVRYGLDPRVCCLSYLAYNLMYIGPLSEAVETSKKAIALARSLNHPYTLTFALAFASYMAQHLEEKSQTGELAAEVIRISSKNEFQFWNRQQRIFQAWANYGQSKGLVARRALESAVDIYLEGGPVLEATRVMSLLAEVYLEQGDIDACLSMLQRALVASSETGEQFYVAEIHRLMGAAEYAGAGRVVSRSAFSQFEMSLKLAKEKNSGFWQRRTLETVNVVIESHQKLSDLGSSTVRHDKAGDSEDSLFEELKGLRLRFKSD